MHTVIWTVKQLSRLLCESTLPFLLRLDLPFLQLWWQRLIPCIEVIYKMSWGLHVGSFKRKCRPIRTFQRLKYVYSSGRQ